MSYTNMGTYIHVGEHVTSGYTRRVRSRSTLSDLAVQPEKPKPFNVEKEWAKVRSVWKDDKEAWARYAGVKLNQEES